MGVRENIKRWNEGDIVRLAGERRRRGEGEREGSMTGDKLRLVRE